MLTYPVFCYVSYETKISAAEKSMTTKAATITIVSYTDNNAFPVLSLFKTLT